MEANDPAPEATGSECNDLLPCPFCGGKANMEGRFEDNQTVSFQPMCITCPCTLDKWWLNEEIAIKKWNTRAR